MVFQNGTCQRGCEFEFQHRVLDGSFAHLFAVKVYFLKKLKLNKKRPWMAHYKEYSLKLKQQRQRDEKEINDKGIEKNKYQKVLSS